MYCTILPALHGFQYHSLLRKVGITAHTRTYLPCKGFFKTSRFFIVFNLSYRFFGVSVGPAGGVNKNKEHEEKNTAVKIRNSDMNEQLLDYVRN